MTDNPDNPDNPDGNPWDDVPAGGAETPASPFPATTAMPVVAASSPFPSGAQGGSPGGPWAGDSNTDDGGGDAGLTGLMIVAVIGLIIVLLLFWFRRCSPDVDRLLSVGALLVEPAIAVLQGVLK